MDDKLLTLNEVSQYLKIPKSTLYKLSQANKFPSIKIGKQLRFRKITLDNWLAEKESRPLPAAAKNQKHIILVDDDQMVLKSLTQLLQKQGFCVEAVASGKEAVERVRKSKFDLLIADIRMPGIDGIETIKQIRRLNAEYKRPAMPEIIITGYIDPRAQQEAQDLGITDYLYKPFSIDEFINAVNKN